MRKKTPAEMEKAKVTKTARTLIRLKHSLAADEEINAFLPDKLDEFDASLARGGKTKAIEPGLDRLLNGDAGE